MQLFLVQRKRKKKKKRVLACACVFDYSFDVLVKINAFADAIATPSDGLMQESFCGVSFLV